METNYVIILDFCGGYLNIIHLTEEEKKESEKYEDFETFLSTLEDKYGFRLKDCQWMTTETLNIYHYENGDKVQLKQLHSIMTELEDMKAPGLHKNGFGQTWLGNLVIKLGGDWEKVYCRGSWDNLLLHEDGTVSFSIESAWDEPNEVREFIEERFPDIRIYYQTEESGMGIYKTNDDTGEYFPEKYYLWVENEETEYYTTLEHLIEAVQNITGSKNIRTLDSCRKALESYSRKNSDLCYTLEEFSVIND